MSSINISNIDIIMRMYQTYLKHPHTMSKDWLDFFAQHAEDIKHNHAEYFSAIEPSQYAKEFVQDGQNEHDLAFAHYSPTPKDSQQVDMPTPAVVVQEIDSSILSIKNAYRTYGHLVAQLDPLGINNNTQHTNLNLSELYKLNPDKANEYDQVVHEMHQIYSGNIGFEYMHITDTDTRKWWQGKIEATSPANTLATLSKPEEEAKAKAIYEQLANAHAFEEYLAKKFPGAKRFGLEGGETTICALSKIIENAAKFQVKEVPIVMAHRGRLNVLHNIIKKDAHLIMSEFATGGVYEDAMATSGDVKYHLGAGSHQEIHGNRLYINMISNPSHLEIASPVLIGKIKARQDILKDTTHDLVMGIVIHGDASIAGQGVVPETFMLSQLDGYKVGGTIHVVINNQVGFSTDPSCSRSTRYCSDVGKMIETPILHVNGDDPAAVTYVAALATEFRMKFKADIIIDICCYRLNGHNEMDEPMFTQPAMYKIIKAKKSTMALYAEKLLQQNLITQEYIDDYTKAKYAQLDGEFAKSQKTTHSVPDWFKGSWDGFITSTDEEQIGLSSVESSTLIKIAEAITKYPKHFNINSKIARLFANRMKMVEEGKKIDWGMAEALAFATLLHEGYPVRLSGQDAPRGTFSHRHATIHDQEDNTAYTPMNNISSNQAYLQPINSPLSEEAVLGFEYGYSMTTPNTLTIWEAQFGDFANGAQVLFDNFISCAEHKWLRASGLTTLLPHGYEGQGPEHSSARIERYLQLCAQYNMQVVNCTTPANYFHVLRRQIHRTIRKPLIIASPKSLLRHPMAVSALSDFDMGSKFMKVLSDPVNKSFTKQIDRIILCSGKIFYDLHKMRMEKETDNTLILRIEQLYPLPARGLKYNLSSYHHVENIIWCQEEPENMGAWNYLVRPLDNILKQLNFPKPNVQYVGRNAAASTATGFSHIHKQIQEQIVIKALGVD